MMRLGCIDGVVLGYAREYSGCWVFEYEVEDKM
jgi:hypothetical protein